ncbi:ABC transporter substrate-binding protein [Aquabacter spiritensis]|uniref:Amino acid/amide ABC transporter substrate-binding protein (HAAT family) n=1 Tax=Aquabacter spiritensis TaxID=933073 RepID=A0A4V2UXX0_9HYPH|nr:ABC transporter substrate-binding protein [Aquabacter spiritensis]TCT05118.1 amino acid/amide ABC transporter substrate-binding protein (HAAT family) [Aquabacter spiritensis]
MRQSTARCAAFAFAVAAFLAAPAARAQQSEIKIGEINSYSTLPAFTEPYRKGWQLAVEEVNAAGGVLGRKIAVLSKDDAGKPADAVTAANELVSSDGVVMLTGTFFSHIGLAVSDYAKQKKVFFLAAEPLTDAITWDKGNAYTFRLRPSNYMQAAMLAEEAAKLPAKRWATIAPNYEYGQSAVAVFKKLLSQKRPDIEWVAEQWPPQGRIDAGAVVQAIAAAKPEAILNVTFGPDLAKLVREGNTRGLFKDRAVVSFLTGEPEYLDPLKDEAPTGWIVTGYPWYAIKTPEHDAFLKAYQDRFKDYPRLGSIVGYSTLKAAAAIIAKAGSTDTDKLIAAAEGISLVTPFGQVVFRKGDHQSTLGAFVGKTAVVDGQGRMVDFVYRDGAAYLPGEAEAAKLRPAD